MARMPSLPRPGPPVFVETRADVIMPLGYPAPEVLPQKIYVSTQGDTWDMISLRVYGMKRRDDHLLHHLLIEANYELRNVSKFPAGIPVRVPPVPIKTEVPLVPWKRVAITQ